MVPYLKGIHLTLDSWRSGRKPYGWRISQIPNTDHEVQTAWYADPDETFDNRNLAKWEWDQDEGRRMLSLEMLEERSTPPRYVKAVP